MLVRFPPENSTQKCLLDIPNRFPPTKLHSKPSVGNSSLKESELYIKSLFILLKASSYLGNLHFKSNLKKSISKDIANKGLI